MSGIVVFGQGMAALSSRVRFSWVLVWLGSQVEGCRVDNAAGYGRCDMVWAVPSCLGVPRRGKSWRVLAGASCCGWISLGGSGQVCCDVLWCAWSRCGRFVLASKVPHGPAGPWQGSFALAGQVRLWRGSIWQVCHGEACYVPSSHGRRDVDRLGWLWPGPAGSVSLGKSCFGGSGSGKAGMTWPVKTSPDVSW